MDDRPEAPPEGATCAAHPERPALVVCPRCGSYACLTCWHGSVRRCHACLIRNPSEAGPGVPWEDEGAGLLPRFARTLAHALQPTRSAPAFARGSARRAVPFALASFLPLAALSGVVPYTHLLAFGGARVRVLHGAGGADLALDVLAATGLGLGLALLQAVALAVPYASLTGAYGDNPHPPAAARLLLYRLWLVPLWLTLRGALYWLVPPDAGGGAMLLAWIVAVLPLLLLLSSMRATARIASGVGPLASVVVVLIPFVLFVVAEMIALDLLAPILPSPEAVERALGVAGAGG